MSSTHPLDGSWTEFLAGNGQDVATRAGSFSTWAEARSQRGIMPFGRKLMGPPVAWASLRERDGSVRDGINFASADYLGLSTHPRVKQAAQAAIAQFGTHSAGPASLAGNFEIADLLATSIGEVLQMPHVAIHPSGWAAGYGTIRAIVGAEDHVLIDAQTSSGLLEGACVSTRRVHRYRHLDIKHVRRLLSRLRGLDTKNTIVVATPSLFPADADAPDLVALQSACHEFRAILIVDVAHDFGCIGPKGSGEPGLQDIVGGLDIVVGSLSKTLASTGGFVATPRADLRDYLSAFSPPQSCSSALGAGQLAAAHAALKIVRSPEGAARRAALQRAVLALRAGLAAHGLELCGSPSPLVPVRVGREAIGRTATRLCAERGVLVNLLEHPLVPKGACRLRLQVMATHEPAICAEIAAKVASAIHAATRLCEGKDSVALRP